MSRFFCSAVAATPLLLIFAAAAGCTGLGQDGARERRNSETVVSREESDERRTERDRKSVV